MTKIHTCSIQLYTFIVDFYCIQQAEQVTCSCAEYSMTACVCVVFGLFLLLIMDSSFAAVLKMQHSIVKCRMSLVLLARTHVVEDGMVPPDAAIPDAARLALEVERDGGAGDLAHHLLADDVVAFEQFLGAPHVRCVVCPRGVELGVGLMVTCLVVVIVGVHAGEADGLEAVRDDAVLVGCRVMRSADVGVEQILDQRVERGFVEGVARSAAAVPRVGAGVVSHGPTKEQRLAHVILLLELGLADHVAEVVWDHVMIITADVEVVVIVAIMLVGVLPHGTDLQPHITVCMYVHVYVCACACGDESDSV
mmetsp:Transcript_2017/g.5597  ORF Transcript_2017/g.5597 Transcript_2017/m.5597 type:complete len:308 (+) Transcript_2017:709-1632(+)